MKYLLLLSFLIGLCACGKSDDELIGDAQLCLDKASSDQAEDCVKDIEHINKPSAQVVKCSSGFLAQGVGKSEQRLLRAVEKLNDKSIGTAGFLGELAFSNKPTPQENLDYARKIDGYCQQTNQPIYILFGAVAVASTTLATSGGLNWSKENPPTAEEMKQAIRTLQASVDEQTRQALREIGFAMLRITQRSCQDDRNPYPRLCAQIDNALNSTEKGRGDAEAVGERLLEIWKNNE